MTLALGIMSSSSTGVTTLHSILAEPKPAQRDVMRQIIEISTKIVVGFDVVSLQHVVQKLGSLDVFVNLAVVNLKAHSRRIFMVEISEPSAAFA
jgi:hypothetical protein